MRFTDLITLHTTTTDDNRVVTSVPVNYNARVEEKTDILTNNKGQEVKSTHFILVPSDFPAKTGDRISILKIRGVDYFDATNKVDIISIMSAGGFKISHKEMMV
jgi:hypothetical protein